VIMLSTLLEPVFVQMAAKLHINVKALAFRVFQMARTFVIVLVGYVFDIAPTFADAMSTFARILTDQRYAEGKQQIKALGVTKLEYLVLATCALFVFAVSVIQERNNDKSLREMLDQKPFIIRYCLLVTGLIALLILGIYGPGFDPAQFVYMQF